MRNHAAIQASQNQTSLAKNISAIAECASVPGFSNNHVCVQRDSTATAVEENAPGLVRETLQSSGVPLDSGIRAIIEPRFGFDFSNVRVHADDIGAASSRAVKANAYTVKNHIAFAPDKYSPSTLSGQSLLAHELTHVVQQAATPVAGTPIDGNLSISHPNDPFENEARSNTSPLESAPNSLKSFHSSLARIPATHHGAGNLHIQRQDDATKAAQESATAGVFSAVFGGISALASVRQAIIAGRQAEAAEDPPVPAPTTGGITATHTDLPEVKSFDKEQKTEEIETTTTKKSPTTETEKIAKIQAEQGPQTETTTEKKLKAPKGSTKTKRTVEKEPFTTTTDIIATKGPTEATVERQTTKRPKEPDQPEKETPFKVLGLKEGKDNRAEYLLTLRHNGKDIKGGNTEDGDIEGYVGGTNSSNASVTFKGAPGEPDFGLDPKTSTEGIATVRLLFGGTNVPPRKVPAGRNIPIFGGLLGEGGYEANKKYTVQRFSGTIRFTASGEAKVDEKRIHVTPKGGNMFLGYGDGKDRPLVTITLNEPGTSPQPKKKDEKS